MGDAIRGRGSCLLDGSRIRRQIERSMGPSNAIVVRRAQRLGSYREGDRGEALVLEQIAGGPRNIATAAAGALGSIAAGTLALLVTHSPLTLAFGIVAGAIAGAAIGHPIDRIRARRLLVPRARLVVGDHALSVFRPGDGPSPVEVVAVADLLRIEAVPDDLDDPTGMWSLVALRASGESVRMLTTRGRTAALRARTLVLERLVRDGAFDGEPMASILCPACRARIVAPHRWLPTSIACGQCGIEGTFARAA